MGFRRTMGSRKIGIVICVLSLVCALTACRSRGPHNKVWESKNHPSDALRKEYNKANKQGTKDYKNSKKRFLRMHRKGKWL